MLRSCSRVIALTAMVAGLSMTAQAAEPTGRLTLTCKGTETEKGGARTTSEQINIGVIVDFQKKAVLGLSSSGEPVPITSISETTISFEIAVSAAGWVMTGTLDRVTGALVASSLKSIPSSGKTILSVSLDLKCSPTQRMF
jgi:ethanolamine utilization microcompartment shell protein EutS